MAQQDPICALQWNSEVKASDVTMWCVLSNHHWLPGSEGFAASASLETATVVYLYTEHAPIIFDSGLLSFCSATIAFSHPLFQIWLYTFIDDHYYLSSLFLHPFPHQYQQWVDFSIAKSPFLGWKEQSILSGKWGGKEVGRGCSSKRLSGKTILPNPIMNQSHVTIEKKFSPLIFSL